MYKTFIRPLFFLLDPEQVHNLTFALLRFFLRIPGLNTLVARLYAPRLPRWERNLWGLTFPNPVGLAAGFDKDAKLGGLWKYLGFGFVEFGTVTPRPQVGNPKKRLFRLPIDQGIINRMGFNNAGLDAMVHRLKHLDKGDMIVGANIGKNKDTPNAEAVKDYVRCFEALYPYVDYFVVNVSSPNTPGLRELQEREPLTVLLNTLQALNQARPLPRPLLLKIAPDLTDSQLDDILDVAAETGLSGLIATNTTISRAGLKTSAKRVSDIGAGGLSGAPLTQRSQEVLEYLIAKAPETLPVIGVGGIMNGKHAQERLAAGAALIQVYSGYVYAGPGMVKEILRSL
ncbi:MAG: quinone-dependent dihydroorotate dehydrogenase [Bacteroidota bacterium]